jgi:hypothetical protein
MWPQTSRYGKDVATDITIWQGCGHRHHDMARMWPQIYKQSRLGQSVQSGYRHHKALMRSPHA